MKKRYPILLILSIFLFVNIAFSHSRGLDRHGCHYNRITSYYHCHHYRAPEYKGDGKEMEAIIIATAAIGLVLMLFINWDRPKADNSTSNLELKDDEIKFTVSYNF